MQIILKIPILQGDPEKTEPKLFIYFPIKLTLNPNPHCKMCVFCFFWVRKNRAQIIYFPIKLTLNTNPNLKPKPEFFFIQVTPLRLWTSIVAGGFFSFSAATTSIFWGRGAGRFSAKSIKKQTFFIYSHLQSLVYLFMQ